MRTLTSISILACLALTGCAAGIDVKRLSPDEQVATGNPWNLGMTQFTLTITRHLVGCGSSVMGKAEVLATPTMVPDLDQRYVLSSKGWWGTSDITSNLAPSGISTGLNAASTDSTAAVISNIVGLAGQIAIGRAVSFDPQGGGKALGDPSGRPAELCKPEVAAAVRKLYPAKDSGTKALKLQVDEAVGALSLATARVSLLTAQAMADRSLRPSLVKALETQAKASQELASLQRDLANTLSVTTKTQVVRWPWKAGEFRSEKYQLSEKDVGDWFDAGASKEDLKQFDTYFAIYKRSSQDGGWKAPSLPPVSVLEVGVPVRLAATGLLMTCFNGQCPSGLAVGEKAPPKTQVSEHVILQLGSLYNVPLTGGSFRSTTAVIAMDSNGLPTAIQVSEKAAAGQALTGALKDTATQIVALPAQIASARLAATQSQTNQITAENALAAAQTNSAVQGQTSALAAQTALVNAQAALATAQFNANLPAQTAGVAAQTALLNAQSALATAQANAGVIDQSSAISAQTSLINAQTAQINAAAALAKAQATQP